MCLSQPADSRGRMHDSAEQVVSNKETLHTDPGGGEASPREATRAPWISVLVTLRVCGSMSVIVFECLPLYVCGRVPLYVAP